MNTITNLYLRIAGWLDAAGHLLDLGIRLYMADVFFRSGLVKVRNWDGTRYLFENEYRVPLLPPELAAWLGTFGELFFPPLLALGLATRFAALSLSAVNVVAVVSFWHVLAENEAARMSHVYWGLLLLVPLCYGPGKLSIDHLLRRHWLAR
ncbi:MAG: DoxX family protein [Betaproteobacteria bacterium]|nr:DoxX family protein [Betaproteobacteria bacterium]MDH5222513.1 DoxX family protein [Betaproteobacteria bacterium]MDH5350044.1 DoxX family protein [Betaproteobacteria bacterium]